MKKISLSLMAIFATVAIVATAASALFTSTATISGVTFSAGNADLRVWDPGTTSWVSNWAAPTFDFSGLYPNYGGTGISEATSTSYQTFRLKNQSTSAISMNIVGTLRAGVTESTPGTSWNVLKDQVLVAIVLPDWSAGTGWHTLNEWYTTGYTLPGGALAQTAERDYRFYVRVGDADNSISDHGISNVNFDFLGTQI